MKKLSIIVLLVSYLIGNVSADMGSCVVYYAKFYLKDGTQFKGCFEIAGFDEAAVVDSNGLNKFCTDEAVFELLKRIQRNGCADCINDGGIQQQEDFGKIAIYKNLRYIQPKPLYKKNQPYYFFPTYGFVTEEDIVYVDSSEIEKTIFWEAKYSERDWLLSEIIVNDFSMVDSVNNLKYWTSIVVDLDASNPDSLVYTNSDAMWGFRLINYSSKNNIVELKRLAQLKLAPIIKKGFYEKALAEFGHSPNRNYSEEEERYFREKYQQRIQRIKRWFWKRGIIMIKINGTC